MEYEVPDVISVAPSHRFSWRPLAVALLVGCSPGNPGTELAGPPPASYSPSPEPPAWLDDVSMVDDDHEWLWPYVPGVRTTMDGRVGLRTQGGSGLDVYLLSPESLVEPVLTGAPGAQMLPHAPLRFPFEPPLAEGEVQVVEGHHAICDPSSDFPVAGERPNPYPCGPQLQDDCYDFHIISSRTVQRFLSHLWGTPVTVEVANPKTVDAAIVRVEFGDPVRGIDIPFSNGGLLEPSVTNDGRLLTGRFGAAERAWTNPETGETLTRSYDLMYAVLPDGAAPCDITQWTEFHPMSHAYHDPNMRGYGLAAYPFRDSEGQPIADGEDMGGSYPWVDREGTNVFMTAVPGFMNEQSETDYPRRCVVAGCEAQPGQFMDFDRGFMVAGLWTHGKLVHLDSRINNMDWSVGMAPEHHYMVDLYRTSDGEPVSVRFGAGRGSGTSAHGYPGNPNILDSMQQLHNHQRHARTVTPRDVVWVMSTGSATDEVVFDDFLDPRAFIVSNMQASITQRLNLDGSTTNVPWHRNGQRRRLGAPLFVSTARSYVLQDGVYDDIHIQNAATTLAFDVPAYGRVEAGTGRTEPIAAGGFHARGFWLNGTNRIGYDVPESSASIEGSWYIGLFVDPRTHEGATRALLTFPDGTSVRLVDRVRLQYVVDERVLHEVTLPAAESGWVHLAWQVRSDHRDVTLLVNGFGFDRWATPRRFFTLGAGTLFLGRGPDRRRGGADVGVRGWVDDFKVLAHEVDPEVACNHAGGTLIRPTGGRFAELAETYPAWAHAVVGEAAGLDPAARYVCFHDYSARNAATLANLPEGAQRLREAITFPEGPLRAGVPRPDSSRNAFCSSCHSEDGVGAMGLGALEFHAGVPLEDDPRRQPHQPPRRVFGNIPAGWIAPGEGSGGPSEAMQAPPEGALVDRWLLDTGT